MKRTILTVFLMVLWMGYTSAQPKKEQVGNVIHLTNEQFKKMVFDYENNKE